MMVFRKRVTPILALVLLLSACSKQDAPPELRTVPMQIGTRSFTLEVADDTAERRKGLMDRNTMPIDRGMIFVFEEEQPLSFYMKRTLIPLDIIFVDASGKIVDIKAMQPLDIRSTAAAAPAKFAIELNHGAAVLAGAKIGDVLIIPAGAKNAVD